jgi:hypothetical protein
VDATVRRDYSLDLLTLDVPLPDEEAVTAAKAAIEARLSTFFHVMSVECLMLISCPAADTYRAPSDLLDTIRDFSEIAVRFAGRSALTESMIKSPPSNDAIRAMLVEVQATRERVASRCPVVATPALVFPDIGFR